MRRYRHVKTLELAWPSNEAIQDQINVGLGTYLALTLGENLCGKIVGIPSIVVSSLLFYKSTFTQT